MARDITSIHLFGVYRRYNWYHSKSLPSLAVWWPYLNDTGTCEYLGDIYCSGISIHSMATKAKDLLANVWVLVCMDRYYDYSWMDTCTYGAYELSFVVANVPFLYC